jgi:hypothetical protein
MKVFSYVMPCERSDLCGLAISLLSRESTQEIEEQLFFALFANP